MKETQQAEQVEPIDSFIQEAIGNDEESEAKVESAPQQEKAIMDKEPEQKDSLEEQQEDVEPSINGVQKRINKVTADKYRYRDERDKLQQELDRLKSEIEAKVEPPKRPAIEDFDYDDEAFQEALVDYKLEVREQKLRADKAKSQQLELEQKQKESQEQRALELQKNFAEKAKEIIQVKPDFEETLQQVPTLNHDVLMAVLADERGPDIAYYLGKNLDIADGLASMNPIEAAVEIGRLSVKLAQPKQVKVSSAPEPIEPVKSGGAIESNMGDEMPIEEWMAKYG